MCNPDRFGLVITNVGEFRSKVFYIVRQLTAKSPQDVKVILDNSTAVPIATGTKREIQQIAARLEKAGAKIKFILVNDDRSN
ncbi:hypothetical protein [Chamaesiphon sp. VAR_69_metabat_338]|uniref:hypothetical protein n=1 Tax=Chamaesiphon sp. VAR_69_metabat_338 TaxID=2964704 RepID=UPI00286E63BB|nr:hypothetical protein [Chamaesiphon sp. VAR_69_metabat_338]